jgi:hypothetical protein
MLLRSLLVGYLICLMGTSNSASGSAPWVLLEGQVDGLPVVIKVMEELPPAAVRERFGWLTVISWRYDVFENDGMPPTAINHQMIQLETAIDDVQESELCVQVYSKTGNGLKELVYYIGDRDEFMRAFNEALDDQPRYPLEIEFFEDREWGDLQTVHRVYLRKE